MTDVTSELPVPGTVIAESAHGSERSAPEASDQDDQSGRWEQDPRLEEAPTNWWYDPAYSAWYGLPSDAQWGQTESGLWKFRAAADAPWERFSNFP